ncbi:MAG TPA: hypothetical protein VL463_28770 [Kofleriaceae bacterium]|nr:hypothetical protein [Kofleriaceae bacterium]
MAVPARADGPPSGIIGPIFGAREGILDVGPQFQLGALWGVEAGWQPMRPAQRIGLALRWRTIFSGYWSADSSNVAAGLRVIEMDGGAYARFAVSDKGRYFDLGGGWSVLRSNVPLAPKNQRSYTGPWAGLALEQLIGDSTFVTFEIRAGELASGPTTLSAIFGVKFGV